ncbi:MAG: hypothetical protein AAFO94_19840 [Bacteroidota bacterium]
MSKHQQEHPKWNYNEFCTYLLLYAANADMEITPEEDRMIRSKVDADRFESIRAEYEDCSDYEIIQTIMAYKGLYFPTIDRRRELLAMIQKEFWVDGDFSDMEKNLMRLLEKLM